jgi:hypothetical protein
MIRQGPAGAWHYRLAYTSEPHAGATIYVFFLALGRRVACSASSRSPFHRRAWSTAG